MSHERWDDYLVAEHEMIERAMGVLEDELSKIEPGKRASARLVRAVDFLLQFGDTIHNAKEEDHLFPLMEERGIPRDGGPLGVMVAEHERERKLLKGMLDTLSGSNELGGDDVKVLVEEARDYLGVRRNHIWKENDILYPMGRRVLSGEDNETLLAAFDQLGQDVYGAGVDGHFKAMLNEAEKGGREKPLIENLSYAQLHAIMETLPVEVTFVDAEDSVAYFNRLDKEKIFVRTRSVIGRKVFKCHPSHSVDKVEEIVGGFRDGSLDKAEFWIDFKGGKVLIRYFPVRDDDGAYMGVLEVTQSIGEIQKLEGQKTLLKG